MLKISPVIWAAAVQCSLLGVAHATITPAPLFTDNAVLQRDRAIPVWGTAEPGEKIIVSFQGKSVETTAGESGAWALQLPSFAAGGPYALTMSGSKSEAITLQNLLVGEVWLCSGQSNMEYPLSGMSPDAITKATIPTVNDPQLRFVMVARTLAPAPQSRVGAKWQEANATTVAPMSAVAYYFARDLRRALNVPVGIVESAFGGTFGQSWLSREALAAQPSLTHYLDEEAAYATVTYPKLMEEYQAKLPEYQKKFDAEKAAYDAAKLAGTPLPRRPTLPRVPEEPAKWQAAPTRLFNGMINPLIPYGIRGAVWYQGEGNWNKGYEYHTLLPALINDWRGRWKQGDFPFYVVQLPPNGLVNPLPERSWWAEVREAQRLAARNLPNTEIVVTTDVGDQKDIHPLRKEPIGARLALMARAGVYGEKIESSGPRLDEVVPEGNQIRVKFTHAAGLRSAQITDRADDGEVVAPADRLTGFTIAGADGVFFNAEAKIEGNSVVLTAPEVGSPVSVRYGWSQFPLANLQNSAGLWASPFRTDEGRLISQPRN
jgi:sialate O-acetylesterase